MKDIVALALLLSLLLGLAACALSSTSHTPASVTQESVLTPTPEFELVSPTPTAVPTPTRTPRPTPIPTLEVKSTWPDWTWNVVAGPSPDIEYIGDTDGKQSVWGKLEPDESISLWVGGTETPPRLVYHLPKDHGVGDMFLRGNKIFFEVGTSALYRHEGIHRAVMAYNLETQTLEVIYEENYAAYRSDLPKETYYVHFVSDQTHLGWMALPDADDTICFQVYEIASGMRTSGPCFKAGEAIITSPEFSWPFVTYVYRDLRSSPPCSVLHIYNMETGDDRIVEGFEKCRIEKGVANASWVVWSELESEGPNYYYSPIYAQNLLNGAYYKLGYGKITTLKWCGEDRFIWAYMPREGGTEEIRSWTPGASFIEKIYRSPDPSKYETYALAAPTCSNGGIVTARKAYWKPEKPGEILFAPFSLNVP